MLAQYEFVMSDYSQHKRFDDEWFSTPFYTGLEGYKMCLNVEANGYGHGAGTHVSVFLWLMKGEHDDKLKWPFQGDITVQLLCRKRDWGHLEYTISFGDDAAAYGSAVRVTSGERAAMGQGISNFLLNSCVTQYLHNDCLKLRVTNIVVRSV